MGQEGGDVEFTHVDAQHGRCAVFVRRRGSAADGGGSERRGNQSIQTDTRYEMPGFS